MTATAAIATCIPVSFPLILSSSTSHNDIVIIIITRSVISALRLRPPAWITRLLLLSLATVREHISLILLWRSNFLNLSTEFLDMRMYVLFELGKIVLTQHTQQGIWTHTHSLALLTQSLGRSLLRALASS
jgi:hypothetical protein